MANLRVLFLGEGDLYGPARYLAAILQWSKIPFDHCPDRTRIPPTWLKRHYSAIILSDYRYANWTSRSRHWLINEVENGVGLIMIGGWGSFTGLVGGYAGTDLEQLLPVRCLPGDDRVNRPGVLIGKGFKLPVTICGYQRCKTRSKSQVVASINELKFRGKSVQLRGRYPGLVLGRYRKGKTAAFMTDCAPHWAGSLVDWGRRRVRVDIGPHNTVEVGEAYLNFFKRLILKLAS